MQYTVHSVTAIHRTFCTLQYTVHSVLYSTPYTLNTPAHYAQTVMLLLTNVYILSTTRLILRSFLKVFIFYFFLCKNRATAKPLIYMSIKTTYKYHMGVIYTESE